MVWTDWKRFAHHLFGNFVMIASWEHCKHFLESITEHTPISPTQNFGKMYETDTDFVSYGSVFIFTELCKIKLHIHSSEMVTNSVRQSSAVTIGPSYSIHLMLTFSLWLFVVLQKHLVWFLAVVRSCCLVIHHIIRFVIALQMFPNISLITF